MDGLIGNSSRAIAGGNGPPRPDHRGRAEAAVRENDQRGFRAPVFRALARVDPPAVTFFGAAGFEPAFPAPAFFADDGLASDFGTVARFAVSVFAVAVFAAEVFAVAFVAPPVRAAFGAVSPAPPVNRAMVARDSSRFAAFPFAVLRLCTRARNASEAVFVGTAIRATF
jgi:hypothetical protein